jgi:hypothetical protein
MRNKGIAIQTILLLVVGILVAGVIIFLVFRTTTSSTLSSTACQSRVISWCTTCRLKGAGAWDQPCSNWAVARCRCLDLDPEWSDWVSKCVVDSARHWNFDPSATTTDYQGDPDGYCPRVGVS